jgi:hypothetical protein
MCWCVDHSENEGSSFVQNVGTYLLGCDGHVVRQIGASILQEAIATIFRVFDTENLDNMFLQNMGTSPPNHGLTPQNAVHQGLVLSLFVLRLFALTPLTNLHHFLIYVLSLLLLVYFCLFKYFFLVGI